MPQKPDFLQYVESTGDLDESRTSPRGFRIGDRVVLPPWEGQPEERGRVAYVPPTDDLNAETIVVVVDEAYVEGPEDDGLRELSDDQCEREAS